MDLPLYLKTPIRKEQICGGERVPGFPTFSTGLSVSGFSMIGLTGTGSGLTLGSTGITVWIGAGLIRLVATGKTGAGMMGGCPPKNGKPGPLFG